MTACLEQKTTLKRTQDVGIYMASVNQDLFMLIFVDVNVNK
jgi:hypothetical protein